MKVCCDTPEIQKKSTFGGNFGFPSGKSGTVAAGFMQHSSCHCWDGIEGNGKGTNMSTCKQKAKRVKPKRWEYNQIQF